MPLPNTFEQMTNEYHKWLLCPHLAVVGYPDNFTHFVNLVDAPALVVTLALCNQCSHVVGSTLPDERLDAALDRRQEKRDEQTMKAYAGNLIGRNLLIPPYGLKDLPTPNFEAFKPDQTAPTTTSAPWIGSEVKPRSNDKP